MLWRVYRSRSKGHAGGGLVRIWEGEATNGSHAIIQATQAYRGLLRGFGVLAEPANNDPYADDPRTIIEEN